MTRPADESSLLVSSAPLGWPDITVERRYLARPGRASLRTDGDNHRVLVWEQPVACMAEVGGHTFPLDAMASPVVIAPAGAAVHLTMDSPMRFAVLALNAAFTREVIEATIGPLPFVMEPGVADDDADFRALAYLLAEAATGHQPLDEAMIAFIARQSALHLVTAYSSHRMSRPGRGGRIPSAKLVQVLDFMATNLHQPLPVALLARQAGLSTAHFSRAFAISTGRSPHAYVMARRVAKAANLLKNSTLSIDQIVETCGFHDQAHMNRLFKRQIGATPRRYRTRHGAPA